MTIQPVKYSLTELREKAEKLLKENSLMRLPVNIERIVGHKVLDLNIVPLPVYASLRVGQAF